MDEKVIKSIVKSLEGCEGKERQKLIADYVYETFDEDELLSLPAAFFAELLKIEKDDICKWYEIKAIGQWKAKEYSELVLDVIMQEDVQFERSSLHLIAAGALGKMGESVVGKLEEAWEKAEGASRIAIIDALGETHSLEAVSVLKKMLCSLSDKEFSYAVLALSKCKQEGNEILKEIYMMCSDTRKLFVIDALAKDRQNDYFLVSLVESDIEIVLNALKLQTSAIDNLKKRIFGMEEGWDKSICDILSEKGVNLDA